MRFLVSSQNHLRGFISAFPVEVVFKFVAPFLDDADGGQSRGIAERAESAPEHIFRKLVDQRNIFRASAAVVEAVQQFAQPGGAFAAGDAPAAGFVRVKMHDAAGEVHHAGVLVNHDGAAGAEHRADLGDGIVVHVDVNFAGAEQRARTAAGDDGFQFFASAYAAGYVFNQLAEIESQRKLVDAGLVDVSGNRIQARAAIFGSAEAGVPIAAAANDGRDGAERFHVVDYGGAAIQADHGRERRLDARIAAFPFEGFHERGFFATFVGAGAGVGREVEIKSAAENIFAEKAFGVGFGDGGFQDVNDVAIFSADVSVALIRSDSAAGDHHTFDQLMRVHFEQRTIFGSARLALVAICENVFWLGDIFGNEAPLHTGGETGAAAAAQIRLFHFVDNLVGCHLLQGFFQSLVAVALQVGVNGTRIGNAEILADDHDFVGIALMERAGNHGHGLRPLAVLQLLENYIHFFGIEIFVVIEIYLHGRSAGAGADTFDLFQGKSATR